MEIFRASVSDRAAVCFLNKCDGSFFSRKGTAIYLSDKGRRIFCSDFLDVLDSDCPDIYVKNGFAKTWKGSIKGTVAELAAAADRVSADINAQTEGRCG